MAASQIRADLFSEFISRSSRNNGHAAVRDTAKSAPELEPDSSASDRRVGSDNTAQTAEPSPPTGTPNNTAEHSSFHSPDPKQAQPWLLLLQLLAEHEGKMCIKSLLEAKGTSTIETLRHLDQLKKMEFVEVTSSSDLDMVKLTTLGRWAAKYVH
jgi:hypothetical protein